MASSLLKSCLVVQVLVGLVMAGEYHGQPDIICSDCHTSHYSERGTLPHGAEPGGPFAQMLLVSSINGLCLSCHDGTDPAAPDVLDPVTMYEGSGSEFSGGGFFTHPDGIPSETGHDLGVDSQVPFAIPPRTTRLSCVSCHDPHGNTSYRNLIPDPDSSGSGVAILQGTDVFVNSHPAIPPERNATIAAYRAGNMGYKSKIVEWCAECHSALHPNEIGNPPAHFRRHPSQVDFQDPQYHLDPAHWISGSGDGFGVATGDGQEGIPRLRFQAPNATDYNTATTVALDNQAFCYSCHLAHGGRYKSSLMWPFNTAGSQDLYSGCQQCHYK